MEPRVGVNKLEDRKGQGLAEYALILMLIALVVIGGLGLLGSSLRTLYDTVTSSWP